RDGCEEPEGCGRNAETVDAPGRPDFDMSFSSCATLGYPLSERRRLSETVPIQRCARGHDCTDCGSRSIAPPSPSPRPPPSPPPTLNTGLFLSLESGKWCDVLSASLNGVQELMGSPAECYIKAITSLGIAEEGAHITFIPKLSRTTGLSTADQNVGHCAYWPASGGCRGYEDSASQSADAWLMRFSGPEHGIQLSRHVPGYDLAQYGCCSWVQAELGPVDPDRIQASGGAQNEDRTSTAEGYGFLLGGNANNAFDGRLGEWNTQEAGLVFAPLDTYDMDSAQDYFTVDFYEKAEPDGGNSDGSLVGVLPDINYFKWAQRMDTEQVTRLGQLAKVKLEIFWYDAADALQTWTETHFLTPVANGVRTCALSYGERTIARPETLLGHACPEVMPTCVSGYCEGGADFSRVSRRRAPDWQTVYHLKQTYTNVHAIKITMMSYYGQTEGVDSLNGVAYKPGAQEIEFGLDADAAGTRRTVVEPDASSSPACAARCSATLGCVAYEISGVGECAL
ncbi:MAG: hypothetical protein ACKVI4_16725, partial [Actinomycetales bacterium]